jgi:hypothetical protein
MPSSPQVAVLTHARVASPASEAAQERGLQRGDVTPTTLHDALARVWPTDAHFVAYEPIEVPVLDADGNDTGETMPVRHTRTAIAEGIPARLNVLVGDVDGPGHVATPEWRAETEARLEASGLAWYRTRNGYRVLEMLPDTYVIEHERDERLWWEFYLGWRETLRAEHGIEIDERCKDWTRIYRLPNVKRDGKPQRSEVACIDAVPTFDLETWREPPAAKAAAPTPANDVDDVDELAMRRAIAIAERMPPSIEGLGGDDSLFRCARELATVLGEDAEAIEFVLDEYFNPRCLPPWDATKLRYEARRAASSRATPIERYAQRLEERMRAAPEPFHVAQPPDPTRSPWDQPMSFLSPEEPIQYLCEGLRLAPARGKISVIAGNPGGGKGPIANHLAVCFALGLKAFGVHQCEQTNVLLIDCEGVRLTMRRLRRLARGLGQDPAQLEGRLVVIDGSTLGDLTTPENQGELERVVRERNIGAVLLDSYTTAMLPTGIDSSTPQYAILAQLLARLDVLVLAIAHRSKANAKAGEPALSDIAYSGAFAALAQTAIVVHYPDERDKHCVHVGCARAPETGFAGFDVRFRDGDGDSLIAEIQEGDAKPSETPGIAKMRATLAEAARDADRVEALLRESDRMGLGMDPRKIRSAIGITAKAWAEARAELRKRGTIIETDLPSNRSVMVALRERVEEAARTEGILPPIGSVASRHVAKRGGATGSPRGAP